MKRKILAAVMALALCLSLTAPAFADTVDSVWNDDYSVLFTTTSNFHSDWGLYDDQYSIQTITGYKGSDVDLTLPSVDFDGEPIQAVGDNAFNGKTEIKSVTIPDGYTSIGASAFSGCTALTSVSLPDEMVRFGFGAFSNCSNLTTINLPASLAVVEGSTFFYCEKLGKIDIPNGVTSIGNSAFWGCSSLASVTIPASVTSIDYGAFMECDSLTDVYYGGTEAQWAAIEINNNQNYNDALLNATIHYGSAPAVEEPVEQPETVSGFSDVVVGMWYSEPVAWAVENNITNGTSATTFSPDSTCTRGQIITFLWRAAGSPEPTGAAEFTDVAAGAYYEKATAWAAENGMTEGDTFSPEAPCTREMAVEFMWKYAGSPSADAASFTDVSSDAVNWAVAEGVTNGTTDTTFSPDSICNRGQIVTFLYRAFAK